MAADNSFLYHEVTLLLVVKGATKDGEVVHEHFHAIPDQFMEYGHHAALKSWAMWIWKYLENASKNGSTHARLTIRASGR
ncbi:hypothetical protein Tco_0164451 [Tanacetum coccineum]